MRFHRFRRAAPALLPVLLSGACGAPPVRGYFAPAGAHFEQQLAVYREETTDCVLDLACQGSYVDRVGGQQVRTVHMQLDVTRARSGDLIVPRDAVVADVRMAPGEPSLTLELSAAWSGFERVEGDLIIPGWSLRPFDLFFDAPELAGEPPPQSVLLRWSGRAAGEELDGQCRFERIPAGDPRLPGDVPVQDLAFGYRNGYYLPGLVRMGVRAWRPSDEERLHYVFHDPGAWQW